MNERSKGSVSAVKQYLIDKGYEVTDTQANKDYQEIDIDLIANNTLIEVKCDFTQHMNCYVEYTSCLETGSLGWYRKTKADYIAYVRYDTKRCFIIKFSELLSLIEECNPKLITHRDKVEDKTKQCYLVPLVAIAKLPSTRIIQLGYFVA